MKARYVIDTNVFIAASSLNLSSLTAVCAMPDDPALRQRVWQWLEDFRRSSSRMVIDSTWMIDEEYRRHLCHGDFGMLVYLEKLDTACCDMVDISCDSDGYAILDEELQRVVHDRADRKMVAVALEAYALTSSCAIAFAADSDWHGWQDTLEARGVELEAVIEVWSRAKYEEKNAKKERKQR